MAFSEICKGAKAQSRRWTLCVTPTSMGRESRASRVGSAARNACAVYTSVVPDRRDPTEGVAVDRHMADGWERQVSGHQQPAGISQVPQQTDPNTGRPARGALATAGP